MTEEQCEKAYRLHRLGFTYTTIAYKMGINDPYQVRKCVWTWYRRKQK